MSNFPPSFAQITLVVPTYNVGIYLHRWFTAISAQTYHDFCCLFVLDKSPDDTEKILLQEITNHSELTCRVLHKEKREGLGKARDYALDSGLLLTKYVIFVDADDLPLPNYLQKLYETAETEKAEITMCGFSRVDEDSLKTIAVDMVHNPKFLDNLSQTDLICFLNPSTWNKLMATSLASKFRYIYTGGVSEDEMFLLKALPTCHKLAFVNEPLYEYRIRSDSLAMQINESKLVPNQMAYIDVKNYYLANPSVYKAFYPYLEASVFLRYGIGLTTRVCLSNKKEKSRIAKTSRQYLDTNFPGWRRNRYLSFGRCARRGYKSLIVWRCRLLYKMGWFPMFVSLYSFFVSHFKKDIKW